MKKQGLIALLFTLICAVPTQAANYSVYVGKPTNKASGTRYYTAMSDYSVPFNVNIPSITMRSGSGIREVTTFKASALNTEYGLACNGDHDVQSVILAHGYSPAGVKNPEGKALWKTDVTGMYVGIEFTDINFGAHYWSAAGMSPTTPIWLDWANGVGETFNLLPLYSQDPNIAAACSIPSNWKFEPIGGVMLWITYHLYIDDTFNPEGASQVTMSMIKTQNYDYHLASANQGALGNGSKSLDWTINFSPIPIRYPACSAAIKVTGNNVSGTTVNLGEHSPEDIEAGLAPQKFTIELDECTYVRDIAVTMSSSNIGSQDVSLLGNSLNSNAAGGVGVLIEGEQNPLSPLEWMTLKPNDSTSVYKFTNVPDSTIGDMGNPQQLMNFRATLKQDGSSKIAPGQFKATGRFTISYP